MTRDSISLVASDCLPLPSDAFRYITAGNSTLMWCRGGLSLIAASSDC